MLSVDARSSVGVHISNFVIVAVVSSYEVRSVNVLDRASTMKKIKFDEMGFA